MTSDRQRARARRRVGAGRRAALRVALALSCGGCFGDWVSARSRPRTEAEPSAAATSGAPLVADPCGAYVAAVAARCDAVLDGAVATPSCHGEIVRVMALYRPDGDPVVAHQRPAARAPGVSPEQARQESCGQHLRALPPEVAGRTAGPVLGPSCRAWAHAVRERCVAPLATIPPDLRGCGPELPAFEGVLGAITFGRPQDYEVPCRDALARMQEPAGG